MVSTHNTLDLRLDCFGECPGFHAKREDEADLYAPGTGLIHTHMFE
jgi:hypothetical protein